MRRDYVFLIILVVGIASYAIVAVSAAAFLPASQRPFWDMGGMMGSGGVMGSWGSTAASTQNTYSQLFWVLSAAAIAVSVLGAGGLVYTIFRPELAALKPRLSEYPLQKPEPSTTKEEAVLPPKYVNEAEAAFKVLKPEELQVVNILREHGGIYLQKWIAKDSGMSRLQAHRVIARLAERKMVTLEKSGNTNEVSLAQWLMGGDK